MSYIKVFSDSPGVQSCKKYIQITLFYFSAVPKSVPVAAQQTKIKMAAIDSLNFGRHNIKKFKLVIFVIFQNHLKGLKVCKLSHCSSLFDVGLIANCDLCP